MCASALAMPSSKVVRVVQWNVLEDGLSDTPHAISFPPAFVTAFDALASELSMDADGKPFFGFSTSRDFTALPEVVPIDSLHALMGFVDVLYNACYHATGGEAQLDGVTLGNTLRTLFLTSALTDATAAPSMANAWVCSAFESELHKATAGLGDVELARARLWEVRRRLFEPQYGTLRWPGPLAARIAKRGTPLYRTWMGLDRSHQPIVRGLRLFYAPTDSALDDERTASALHRFCRVVRAVAPKTDLDISRHTDLESLESLEGDEGGGEGAGEGEGDGVRALIEMVLAPDDTLLSLRTPTLAAALHWLVQRMCEHAGNNPRAAAAVAAFCATCPLGEGSAAASVVSTVVANTIADDADASYDDTSTAATLDAGSSPSAWATAIYARLAAPLAAWQRSSGLGERHARVSATLSRVSPDLLCAVEADASWRALPLPAGRRYVAAEGKGTARIVYDADLFEEATVATCGVEVPNAIRSLRERGAAESAVAPKSSRVLLLRRKADGRLLLLLAAHFESGKPSDSIKVALRAAQLKALLGELEEAASALRRAGRQAVLIVAGDLNAVREEFLYGNSAAFFEAPGVRAIVPPLRRPSHSAARVEPPEPPLAKLGESGELCLACASADGGWLREVSAAPARVAAQGHPVCTRAGSNMAIDFILLGSLGGGGGDGSGGSGSNGGGCSGAPHALVPPEDVAACADPIDGTRVAIGQWGSDHLPVGTDLEIELHHQRCEGA